MTTYIVAVYDIDRAYGGREEGGWWYEVGSLTRQIRQFRNQEQAYEFCRKLNRRLHSRTFGPNQGKRAISSVLSDGEYQAEVHENYAPKHYPERKPRYE